MYPLIVKLGDPGSRIVVRKVTMLKVFIEGGVGGQLLIFVVLVFWGILLALVLFMDPPLYLE